MKLSVCVFLLGSKIYFTAKDTLMNVSFILFIYLYFIFLSFLYRLGKSFRLAFSFFFSVKSTCLFVVKKISTEALDFLTIKDTLMSVLYRLGKSFRLAFFFSAKSACLL